MKFYAYYRFDNCVLLFTDAKRKLLAGIIPPGDNKCPKRGDAFMSWKGGVANLTWTN